VTDVTLQPYAVASGVFLAGNVSLRVFRAKLAMAVLARPPLQLAAALAATEKPAKFVI
jgi:hypothetical protein